MASCIGEISANIQLNCSSPLVGGYTGRAILIPYSNNPVLTQNAQNPRIITAIAMDEGAKVCAVDNVGTTPFDGSTTASTGDAGFVQFTKTVALRVLARGAANSLAVVEPLVKSPEGFIAILEKMDKSGDGSYEVIGALAPLKATADGTTRTETENGGAINVTMTCTEAWFEASLFIGNFADSKAYFDNLYENSAF